MDETERILEIKTSLDGTVQEFDCIVAARAQDHVVIRYRMVKDHNLHGVPLHAGELTFGYFWFDRPYNLYHWVRADGASVAWYFNIGSVTHFDGNTLRWRDDAIDILATPDGNVRVLDVAAYTRMLETALTGAPSMGDEAIRVVTPMGSAISASASTATPNAFVAVRVPGVARASARAMSARAHIASMSPAGATTASPFPQRREAVAKSPRAHASSPTA